MAAKQIKTNISSGEEYEFLDINGKPLFTICINPTDMGLIKRADELVDFLNNLIILEEKTDDETEENRDLETDMKVIFMTLEKAEKELAEKLDHLFNAPISDQIYSVMDPFTPLKNGKLYIEEILDSISSVIEAEMKQRTKKVQSRMDKYTAKYHK